MLLTPPPIPKLSHLLGLPPLERDVFMDGPRIICINFYLPLCNCGLHLF